MFALVFFRVFVGANLCVRPGFLGIFIGVIIDIIGIVFVDGAADT